MYEMTATSIGDALFTKTQQRVLGLLYGAPDKSFYTNDIVRRAGMGSGTVRRELERLVDAGVLAMRREGNQLHYQANPACPVFHELLGIVQKTFGLVEVVREALLPVYEQIDWAFIFGSIAKQEETSTSDVDLLVIADALDYTDLMTVLNDAETALARPINPSIYTMAQIQAKLRDGNAFLSRVMEQPKLWVKGCDDDFSAFG